MTLTIQQQTMYEILIWLMPILLAIIAFIGALAVKQFIAMNNNLNELNTKVAVMITKHDNLESRVEELEDKI
jgi:cell division protein FtsL